MSLEELAKGVFQQGKEALRKRASSEKRPETSLNVPETSLNETSPRKGDGTFANVSETSRTPGNVSERSERNSFPSDRAKELRRQGKSFQEIAETIGTSKAEAWRRAKDAEKTEDERTDEELSQEIYRNLDEGKSQRELLLEGFPASLVQKASKIWRTLPAETSENKPSKSGLVGNIMSDVQEALRAKVTLSVLGIDLAGSNPHGNPGPNLAQTLELLKLVGNSKGEPEPLIRTLKEFYDGQRDIYEKMLDERRERGPTTEESIGKLAIEKAVQKLWENRPPGEASKMDYGEMVRLASEIFKAMKERLPSRQNIQLVPVPPGTQEPTEEPTGYSMASQQRIVGPADSPKKGKKLQQGVTREV